VVADLGLPRERVLVLYGLGTLIGILPAPSPGGSSIVSARGGRSASFVMAVAWPAPPWRGRRGRSVLPSAFTLLRGTAIGGLSLVSGHMINLWFEPLSRAGQCHRDDGLALGGLAVPAAAEQLAIAYGWRVAYLALGATVVAIMLPFGLIFFRNRPQSYGLMPDFGKTTATGPPCLTKVATLGDAGAR